MSFKPTTLIVCADLDDLQNKKRALIDKYEKTDKFEKWSDYAVELKERLFVFKVINLTTEVLDAIRGYDKVESNHLSEQIANFTTEVNTLCDIDLPLAKDVTPEPQNGPEESEKVEEAPDTKKEQKKNKSNK
jgi:uncharacterized membrane protein YgaE (UPF0421/DUF939 family)